jgi:hypothetical protein
VSIDGASYIQEGFIKERKKGEKEKQEEKGKDVAERKAVSDHEASAEYNTQDFVRR